VTGIEFALVLLAWAVGGGSPGPATMAIAGTSMNRGRGPGLAVAAGIVSGSAAWGLAAALGLSALMAANAWIVEILRYVGAAYLLYLAFKAARSAMTDIAAALYKRAVDPFDQPQGDPWLGGRVRDCGAGGRCADSCV